MMIVNVHKTPEGRKIVAICDKDVLGKVFTEKKIQLDLSSDFYKGEEKAKDEIKRIIVGAYILNLAGENSVKLGIETGVISGECVIKIANIPHAQAILL